MIINNYEEKSLRKCFEEWLLIRFPEYNILYKEEVNNEN